MHLSWGTFEKLSELPLKVRNAFVDWEAVPFLVFYKLNCSIITLVVPNLAPSRKKGDCKNLWSGTLDGSSTFWTILLNSIAAVQNPSPGRGGPRLSRNGPLMASWGGRISFLYGFGLGRST